MPVTNLQEYTVTTRLNDIGKTVVIPRINGTSSDPAMPLEMSRIQFQFLLKVPFAMSINKYQGQTFQRAGLYWQMPHLLMSKHM
ncbi:hypothetical protein AVEN_47457-1 [Araneus ventricosus]|uniref:ATP-dependent DNA helicase n=1 Tax=Araneus ventricosus TaxID=182803 RepID=A0A4Y2IRY6_ARAVE|nr:hypothetical protein AVEN_47457-1 [Araneus ventricosus]